MGGTYNIDSQIKFTTTKSSLFDYNNAYILVKRKITVVGAATDNTARAVERNNKQVIFKNFAPFTNCITEINNTRVDNAKDLDVVTPMSNLVE